MRTKFLTLLAILFVGFAFANCSSDDDKDDGEDNEELTESIVGTWKCSYDDGYTLITFKSNGKGVMKEIYYPYSEYNEEESFTYSYNSSSNVLKMYFGDELEEYEVVSVTSKVLVIKYYDYDDGVSDIETYTKQ